MSSLSLVAIPRSGTCIVLTMHLHGGLGFWIVYSIFNFLFVHGKFSECDFNVQQSLFIIIVHYVC